MGTTTQAAMNNSEIASKSNFNTNDTVLQASNSVTEICTSTSIAKMMNATIANTASNTSTTHIISDETKYTYNVLTAQNIKILPKESPPPQVVIIPANQASAVATNAAKKIRRAFSIPRNPFRWSHKLKSSSALATCFNNDEKAQDSGGGEVKSKCSGISALSSIKSYTLSSCVGGKRERAGSIVSLNNNDENYVAATDSATHSNTPRNKNILQNQSFRQTNQGEEEKSNGIPTKNSNKKLTTKSNTINGVSSLSNSSTLPTGASLFSTLPAGNSNSGNVNSNNRVFRRSSFRKFLNRVAQHMTTSSNKPHGTTTANGHTLSSTADRVPPISGYQWPNDQTPGVMGLKNHGNTCFMNAVLQCLSHTDILAEYFVLDQYKADLKRRNKINSRKFGTKGELTEQLANVLKALWTCKNESDHSTSFKAVVDRYGSQFRSSTQHDAQEFLFWLLDKVHEDLNTATKRRYKSVKNNYGRPDEIIAAETLANHIRCNNSFVQAVFQAQFRSSLTCPRCKKQSNTFDPFHCVSVQLPQLTQQTIFVTVVYLTRQPRQVRMGLTVTAGLPIMALREQLHKDTGIPNERMVLVDLRKEGFMRVFYDTQPVNTLQGIETIFCIEVPLEKKAVAAPTNTNNSSISETNANNPQAANLLVVVANVKKSKLESAENEQIEKYSLERFGAPFSLQVPRDCSYSELQKKLLKEMSALLKPEVFSYATPLVEMFQIRLQDPSADPDTFIEQVEHPLLTEMIDLALSVLSAEAGPAHVKLLLEWQEPETYFCDLSDQMVEHESVPLLLANKTNDTAALTLEQCLEHYTKAETLSAEDAWRCPNCQEYLPVVKTLGLWSLPDILVVHFKRFRQHHGKGANAAKLTTMVNFPLHSFDMSPHLARGVNDTNTTCNTLVTPDVSSNNNTNFNRPSPWRKSKPGGDSRSSTLSSRDNRETRYDLYAVCYHQGDTLETGHYTAACKNPYDRQWYKFDDQRVSKVSSETLPDEIVNNEAYMLFYQRRTAENAECSGSSSNSSDHWVSRIALPAQVPIAAASPTSVAANLDENIIKTEAITAKATVSENIKVEAERPDSKGIIVVINKATEEVFEEKENNDAQLKKDDVNSMAAPTCAQNISTENNLDALEKLLDYADADDIINDETDGLEEKLERLEIKKAEEHNSAIFVMDEECKFDEEMETKEINTALAMQTPSKVSNATNGYDIMEQNSIKSPLVMESDVVAINNGMEKEKTIMCSTATSSSSSLSSQSPAPSSLAISKDAANNLQNKFNGFLQSPSSASAANEKEHLLSSSLKSNSSSIIGSALAGHFSTYRQPWHGSRSSVSAIENAIMQPSTAVASQHSSLHLRHSFSTSSNYRLRECSDTLSSVLRNSVNTCSKDTLIFLDQQQHHHRHHQHHSLMEDDDDSTTFMGSRSLWISPVTPHKLITVSPKN